MSAHEVYDSLLKHEDVLTLLLPVETVVALMEVAREAVAVEIDAFDALRSVYESPDDPTTILKVGQALRRMGFDAPDRQQ